MFLYDLQDWGNCDHVQNAIALDMEMLRIRLWILDKGSKKCSPKLVIHSLYEKSDYTSNVPDYVPQDKLSSILIDNDLKLNGPRAYIGVDGEAYLVIFSLRKFQWLQIFVQSTKSLPISTKFLSFSRPESLLYITGAHERAIFSLNLNDIEIPWDEVIIIFSVSLSNKIVVVYRFHHKKYNISWRKIGKFKWIGSRS